MGHEHSAGASALFLHINISPSIQHSVIRESRRGPSAPHQLRRLNLPSISTLTCACVVVLQPWKRLPQRTRCRNLSLRARGGEEFAVQHNEYVKVKAEEVQWWWEQSAVEQALSEEQQQAKCRILESWKEIAERPVLLHGLTGTGKTRLMAAVAKRASRPVLVLAHNKELAKQLYREMGEWLNVHLLVSRYEQFVPARVDEDGELLKGFMRIDKEMTHLRQAALKNICSGRRPVVIASVSALYHTLDPTSSGLTVQEEADACTGMRQEMEERVETFVQEGKQKQAEQLKAIIAEDLHLLRQGRLHRLQRYAKHLPQRLICSPVEMFERRFKRDWVLMVDECHAMLPRLGIPSAMTQTLLDRFVEHGYMLPSALENSALGVEDLFAKVSRKLFVSATPVERHFGELGFDQVKSVPMVQRPTHILDPKVCFMSMQKSFYNLMFEELSANRRLGRQSLVACCTVAEAELLALRAAEEFNLQADVVHGDLDAKERQAVINEFKGGKTAVLFGVRLICEGMNFPGVSLVFVLDADRGGLSRSSSALLQFVGRAARHMDGTVVLAYRRAPSEAMCTCKRVSEQQRKKQAAFNRKHGLKPKALQPPVLSEVVQLSPRLQRKKEEVVALEELLREIPGVGARKAALLARSCSWEALLKRPKAEMRRLLVDGIGQATRMHVWKFFLEHKGSLQSYGQNMRRTR